ncbi:MAG TPA: sulfotransferase, partial [Gammaproteobacteria bacterium]|nr:sulfotransferase [Gammaproteobacteria bacterium]
MPARRVLVNSLPKSGTHLLTKAVSNLGYREYGQQRGYLDTLCVRLGRGTPWLLNYRQAQAGRKHPRRDETDSIRIGALTEYRVNPATLHHWLQRLETGSYIQGHMPFSPDLPPLLAQLDFRHLLIMRDPRAVLASLLHYIPNAHLTDMGPHFLAADFADLSPAQQLALLLDGGHAPRARLEILPFATVFRSLAAWRADSTCLLVRFEDLVGIQGGGSAERQAQTLHRIAAHLGLETAPAGEVYDREARTFRQGQVDGWRRSLDADAVHRIQTYCAPLCAELEYP